MRSSRRPGPRPGPPTPTWPRSFRRIAGPRADGKRNKKAAVAVGHKILIAAYHIMATPDEVYRDLGGDYFTRRDNPDRRKTRLVSQLQALGFDVQLTAAA
ncbi:hypothetical protein BH20ACT8_BH20ACT8_07310 [soil metagenome]